MISLRVYWTRPEKDTTRGFTTVLGMPAVPPVGCHLTFGDSEEVFKIRYLAYEVDSGEFVAHLTSMRYAGDAIESFMKHHRSSEFKVDDSWLQDHYDKIRYGRDE